MGSKKCTIPSYKNGGGIVKVRDPLGIWGWSWEEMRLVVVSEVLLDQPHG